MGYNAGFSKMTGYNNIPDAPEQEPGTVYYFLGMENMRGGPVSILQPVLAYQGGAWTGASCACCPSNITTTGPTIGPAKEGDRMYGSMIRTDDSTCSIVTQFNGQTSTLNAQVGPWAYTWAVATFEDYGVSQCSQLPEKAVVFDSIVLKDSKGKQVTPSWTLSGTTMCNGRTMSPRPDVVSIQHGNAPPSPIPAPSPTPTPTPTPSPMPVPTPSPTPVPGTCHAVSSVVTDDWCEDNCAAGFCPSDQCKCDTLV